MALVGLRMSSSLNAEWLEPSRTDPQIYVSPAVRHRGRQAADKRATGSNAGPDISGSVLPTALATRPTSPTHQPAQALFRQAGSFAQRLDFLWLPLQQDQKLYYW